MASMMQMGFVAPDTGNTVLSRTIEHDRPGLTPFRTRPETDHARSLTALIESEIIPRLVVAHSTDAKVPGLPVNTDVIGPGEVEALAPLALQVDADRLLMHIEAILARGVSVDTVMVDLLAPTARLLGEHWESDQCDFIDVTMGLWRLQEVVHEIACRAPTAKPVAIGGHRALFASMPGDQHSFGTVVIDELFRRDGWVTERISDADTKDLLKRVADDWFDIIGLTVSCDRHIAALPSVIAALRNVSRNSRVCVMVGGRVFSADPARAVQVGADGTAPDAKLALTIAEGLVRNREREAAACS